jgi:xylulokinase
VAGTPVVLGAADSVLGALGLGLTTPGQVAYIAGTSTVILALADTLSLDPAHRYLVTPMASPGSWGLEMDLLATGSAHAWLAGLLADGDQAELARLADQADPETAPLFLPYLLPGEQGVRWNPDLAGALSGLHLGHRAGDLARGLRNGIVAESRHCLAVLESAAGRGEILMAGGGALAPSLASDLADATGRVTRPPDPSLTDSSAIGAAMVAAAGAAGQSLAVHPDAGRPGLVPDRGRSAWWERQAERHESAVAGQIADCPLADEAVEGGQALDDPEDGDGEHRDHDQRDRDAPVPDGDRRDDEDDDDDRGVVVGLWRLDLHGDSWHALPSW